VDTLDRKIPIQFVFIRATVGNDRVDKAFEENWLGAKKNNLEEVPTIIIDLMKIS
jgi:lysozyme